VEKWGKFLGVSACANIIQQNTSPSQVGFSHLDLFFDF
jgi:hypothetical protein